MWSFIGKQARPNEQPATEPAITGGHWQNEVICTLAGPTRVLGSISDRRVCGWRAKAVIHFGVV